MRVYYIGNNYDGCYYVRCLLPMRANGWSGERTTTRERAVNPQQLFQEAMASDVIVFHRPDVPAKVKIIPLLRQAGKVVIFDNDDTYLLNSGNPTRMLSLNDEQVLNSMNANLYQNVTNCNAVTTTTDFLRNEYLQFNPNVYVLPNMVDPDDWEEPMVNTSGKIRIGFVGSVAHNRDYLEVKNLLDILAKRKDVEIVLFAIPKVDPQTARIRAVLSEEIDFWNQYPHEWQHTVKHYNYNHTLNRLKLDMMLIPRHESYFNKCKSNLKFLEASMLKIPVIASSFSDGNSPYDKDFKNDVGILCSNEKEWIKETLALIDSPDRRKQLGENAYNYVLENYNIETKGHLWDDIYQKYYDSNKSN